MAGAYNAGSVEASLRLDRSEFNRELRGARTDAEEFGRTAYTATVTADTTDARSKLQALQTELKALKDISLTVALVGYRDTLDQLKELGRQARGFSGTSSVAVGLTGYDTTTAHLTTLTEQLAQIDGRNLGITTDMDTTGVLGNLATLQERLDTVDGRNLGVAADLDTAPALGSLLALQERLDALDNRSLNIAVDLDIMGALGNLVMLQERMAAVEVGGVHISTDVDTTAALAQLAVIQAGITALNRQTISPSTNIAPGNGPGNGPGSGGRGRDRDQASPFALPGASMLMSLPGIIAALSPLIPPLVTLLGGASAAAVAFGVSAGGAMGIYGMATMGAVKETMAHIKAIQTTEKALKQAQVQLAGTTAGTTSYKKALAEVTAAEKAHRDAVAALTAPEKAFADQQEAMKKSWKGFVQATEGDTLKPVVTVMKGLSAALPTLIPLVHSMAPAFQMVAVAMKNWLSGEGLHRFVFFIQTTGVPIVLHMIAAFRMFAAAGGAVMRAFGPIAVEMAWRMEGVSRAALHWSQGGGVLRFRDQFFAAWRQLKPIFGYLLSAISGIWGVLSGTSVQHSNALVGLLDLLAQAMANLKPAFIKALNEIFQSLQDILVPLAPVIGRTTKALVAVINALPPGTIRLIADALIAWKLAVMGWAAVQAIITGVTAAINVFRWSWILLQAAIAISPIGMIIIAVVALIAVIVLIATKTTWFQTAWKYTWNAIKTAALWTWETVLKPTFNAIWGAIQTVGTWAMWLWNHAIKPAWDGISAGAKWLWGYLEPVFVGIGHAFATVGAIWWKVYSAIFKVIFIFIEAGIKVLWLVVIKPIFAALAVGWSGLVIGMKWAWEHILKPAWDSLAFFATWLWDHAIKPTFSGISKGWDKLVSGITWAWNHLLKPAWNAVAGAASDLWKKHISPTFKGIGDTISEWWAWLQKHVFDPVGHFFTRILPGWAGTLSDKLVSAFDTAKKKIGKVWDGIKKTLGTPIKFAIDKVWNDTIVQVVKSVSEFVGEKNPLGKIDTSGIPHFAAGGPVPMVPGARRGRDSVNAVLMPDEHVLTASEVQAMGGHGNVLKFRSALMGGQQAQGANATGQFGLGGWMADKFSGGWDAVTHNAVTDAIGNGLKKLKDATLGALGTVANPLLNGAKTMINNVIPGNGSWSNLARGIFNTPIDMIKDFIGKKDKAAVDSGFTGTGGAIPTGQHLAILVAALKAAGIPTPSWPIWEQGLNTLITRESGWNPRAINLWDSNAKAGHPSKGLAQTIDPTFQSYRVASLPNDVYNPIANVAAAIRYIVAQYGDITHVQQAFGSTPKGYATGTAGAAPGLAWVGEKGPELVDFRGGETVHTHQQSMRMALDGHLPGYATGTYKIRSGDTLSEIAKTLHTTVSALAKLNHISNPNRIYAGSTLHYTTAAKQASTARPTAAAARKTVAAAYTERDKDQARAATAQAAYNAAHTKYLNATTAASQQAAKREMAKYQGQLDRVNKEIKADNDLIKKNAARYKQANAQVLEQRKDADTLAAARKRTSQAALAAMQQSIADFKARRVAAIQVQRDALAVKIQTATDARGNYLSSAQGIGTLSSLGGPATTRSLGDQLAGRRTTLQGFQRNLAALSKLGLNKALLDQILAMGPDAGLAYSRELLKTANAASIKTLNGQYGAFESAASAFADAGANEVYDLKGLKNADAVLAGQQVTVTVTAPRTLILEVDGKSFTAHTATVVEHQIGKVVAKAKQKR